MWMAINSQRNSPIAQLHCSIEQVFPEMCSWAKHMKRYSKHPQNIIKNSTRLTRM